jgi:protein TonB
MMQDNCKNERIAVSVSLLLHSIVFILIASTGFFVYERQPQKQVMDVAIYDAEEKSGSSGRGSSEPAVSVATSNSGIVMKADMKKPAISEHYAEEAQQEEQQKEKAEKQQTGKSQVVPNHNTVGNGSSDKVGGEGIGKGGDNGIEKGNKGTGTGNGAENGDDNANALRPKIPPHIITAAAVSYPEKLRSDGIEGQVVLKMLVGADGRVERVLLVGSSGYDEMDRAAESAAYQYYFSPAENSAGDPVRCGVQRTFQFRLN